MKYIVSGDKYNEGLKLFLTLYYKEELKKGSLRKAIIAYSICLIILALFSILMPGLRQLYFALILFLLGFAILMSGIIFLTILITRKKGYKNNILKVEQTYEEKIIIETFFEGGSSHKTEYNYSSIKKVIEYKDFFYIFLNDSLAFPLYKHKDFDRERFVEKFVSNGIFIKEDIKWDIM